MFTPPTVSDFKTKFSNFSVVDDATIQMALDEAIEDVGETWLERDRPRAILYLAAHILTLDGEPENSSGTSAPVVSSAGVKREKIGDVEVEYAVSSSDGMSSSARSWLQRTYYGQRYLELVRKNFPSVLVV